VVGTRDCKKSWGAAQRLDISCAKTSMVVMTTVPASERSRITFARTIASYVLPIALVSLAALLTRKIQPILGEISPLFFAAVVVSTWFGGLGPALLATLLAGAATAYFSYDIPAGTGAFGWDDLLRLSVFLMVALLMSSLMHLRRRADESLRKLNDQLELRVRDRTRELESSTRMVVESEERFRILMEGVSDYAICMLDLKGNVISWNAGSQRIHGYREAEICGKSFALFFTIEDQQHYKPGEHIDHATSQGRDEDEGWRIRKDGTAFRANVIISALRNPEGVLQGFAHITRDITELKRLEREVLEISENEQQRIGQDLHDGLGQELTGLAFLSQDLGRKLAAQSLPEPAEAAQRITRLVTRAIEQTRELARGLSPVELSADGLVAALLSLTDQMQRNCGIPIEVRLDDTVRVQDHNAAVHIYRIMQEAMTNAARHSGAKHMWLCLEDVDGDIVATVEDDGVGIPTDLSDKQGMGLRLMLYRARMIGASPTILQRKAGGTVVRCVYRNALGGRLASRGIPGEAEGRLP
jgi:PAS domain S-box-containing protein